MSDFGGLLLKDTALSDIQINEYFKNNKHFRGALLLEEIVKEQFLKDEEFWIVLLRKNSDIGHWIVMYRRGNKILVFNSFGINYPNINDWIKSKGKGKGKNLEIFYNDSIYQKVDSSLCGFWCIYVGERLSKGEKYKTVLKEFKNYPNNKYNCKILLKYFRNVK